VQSVISSFQKLGAITTSGVSFPLASIRERSQSMPIGFAVYQIAEDSGLKAFRTPWQDKMDTYRYCFESAGEVEKRAEDKMLLRHVSTGNLIGLQTEACELLESIQTDVELRRDSGFFTLHVFVSTTENNFTRRFIHIQNKHRKPLERRSCDSTSSKRTDDA
jgi:hypothetical protein